MIADIISKKKINQIVTELFIREKKLTISTLFITQSYFSVPVHFKLNYFFIKIPNNIELQQTNHI